MTRLVRLLDSLGRHGDEGCLYSDGAWHSYADLVARIGAWRQYLSTAGVQPGLVLGVQADYSLHSVAFLLAAWEHGLVVALVPRETDPEPCLVAACADGNVALSPSGAVEWTTRSPEDRGPLLDRLTAAADAGIVIFTSGSTGRAKAALHSVDRFLRKFDRPGRALRTLAFLQFDHVAGLDTLLYTLSAGGGLVVPPERDPQRICSLIEAARVEVLSASPSFLRLLWASGAAEGRDLSSLAVLTYGSEPMDVATLQRVNELFPGVRISQKYGTTETGAPRTISRSNDSLWIQIRDDGVETQVREGILWIRSEGSFLGYLNAEPAFDAEGWYCTGDLVEVDGPWMRILCREDDLINVGGEKVSPVEVEQVILELEQIAAVAVSAAAHPLMGQIVTARVVLRPGCDSAGIEARVRRHCRGRLPHHKVPVTVDVATASLSSGRQKLVRDRT